MLRFREDHPGHIAACYGIHAVAVHIHGPLVEAILDDNGFFGLRLEGTDIDPRAIIRTIAAARIELAPGANPTDKVAPIQIVSPDFPAPLRIDWWCNQSQRAFKMWSGRMSSLGTSQKLLKAMQTMPPDEADPFEFVAPLTGRLGFDPESGRSALDIGFSPDRVHMHVLTPPVVELLAAIGLQRWQFQHVGRGLWEYTIAGIRRRFSMTKRGKNRALKWAEEVFDEVALLDRA